MRLPPAWTLQCALLTLSYSIILILTLDVITQFGEVEKIGEPSPLNKIAPEATTISGNDFYGAKKETSAAPQSMPSRPAPSNNTAMGNIHPIEGLSPYSHKWTIKARVTSKSDIKRWHKASSEGRLFSVNLLDESGEIKATGFNDQCDMFFDLLQEGSVYYISAPCRVQIAKKQFSNLSHDYEMTFENGTSIVKAEDQSSVPQMRFNFCNIQDLQNVEKDNTVDIIGVLKEVGEESQITSKKTGQPFSKRDLTIVDDTGYSVRVTVWGAMASSFEAPTESVLAFKGTKVSDFNGKSLSLLSSGTMSVDPDISDAHRLKGWYDSTGRTDSFATHQNTSAMGTAGGRKDDFKTIAQVKEENIGVDDQQYYSIKATIVFIRNENFAYPACPREECKNKKVISMGDGTWRCESCDSTHDRAEYRYIMSINVADHTNHQWLSCFDETGRTIMGMSATELTEIQQTDDARFKSIFESVNCQTLKFRCRAKMDTYGGAQKYVLHFIS